MHPMPKVSWDGEDTLAIATLRGDATVATAGERPSFSGTARYQLGELIGRGGMGEVRSARDLRIGRDVAVKLLRSDQTEAEMMLRFVREARVQGRLEHPSIVPVHDMGEDAAGQPFFVMKRLTGATLLEILERGEGGAAWNRRQLLSRLVDVCQEIAFAHQRGVVHRDLKPGNIMLGDFGEVYVLDWGIARILDDEQTAHASGVLHRADLDSIRDDAPDTEPGSPRASDPQMTQVGALLGTPGYMAPEQLRGDPVGPPADVYALGCVLFEILTQSPALPRGREAFEPTLSTPAHRPRLRAPDADIPPELDDLCAAATALATADRLPGAAALAAGIQRYLDGDRDLERRRELADRYAAEARALLDQPGSEPRGKAMAAAGRALGLDPSHRDAQALIGRLLLESPAEMPPEVAMKSEAARVELAKVQLRAGARVYLAYFLVAPILLLTSIHAPLVLVAVGALLVLNAVVLALVGRSGRPVGRFLFVSLPLHCALLTTSAILFSPLIVLPTLAATSVTAFISHPTRTRPWVIVVLHLAAVIGPLVAELVGLLPRTFSTAGDSLTITPWAVVVPASQFIWVATLINTTQVIAGAILVMHLRRAEEAAQQAVYLNAWHLGQLLR